MRPSTNRPQQRPPSAERHCETATPPPSDGKRASISRRLLTKPSHVHAPRYYHDAEQLLAKSIEEEYRRQKEATAARTAPLLSNPAHRQRASTMATPRSADGQRSRPPGVREQEDVSRNVTRSANAALTYLSSSASRGGTEPREETTSASKRAALRRRKEELLEELDRYPLANYVGVTDYLLQRPHFKYQPIAKQTLSRDVVVSRLPSGKMHTNPGVTPQITSSTAPSLFPNKSSFRAGSSSKHHHHHHQRQDQVSDCNDDDSSAPAQVSDTSDSKPSTVSYIYSHHRHHHHHQHNDGSNGVALTPHRPRSSRPSSAPPASSAPPGPPPPSVPKRMAADQSEAEDIFFDSDLDPLKAYLFRGRAKPPPHQAKQNNYVVPASESAHNIETTLQSTPCPRCGALRSHLSDGGETAATSPPPSNSAGAPDGGAAADGTGSHVSYRSHSNSAHSSNPASTPASGRHRGASINEILRLLCVVLPPPSRQVPDDATARPQVQVTREAVVELRGRYRRCECCNVANWAGAAPETTRAVASGTKASKRQRGVAAATPVDPEYVLRVLEEIYEFLRRTGNPVTPNWFLKTVLDELKPLGVTIAQLQRLVYSLVSTYNFTPLETTDAVLHYYQHQPVHRPLKTERVDPRERTSATADERTKLSSPATPEKAIPSAQPTGETARPTAIPHDRTTQTDLELCETNLGTSGLIRHETTTQVSKAQQTSLRESSESFKTSTDEEADLPSEVQEDPENQSPPRSNLDDDDNSDRPPRPRHSPNAASAEHVHEQRTLRVHMAVQEAYILGKQGSLMGTEAFTRDEIERQEVLERDGCQQAFLADEEQIMRAAIVREHDAHWLDAVGFTFFDTAFFLLARHEYDEREAILADAEDLLAYMGSYVQELHDRCALLEYLRKEFEENVALLTDEESECRCELNQESDEYLAALMSEHKVIMQELHRAKREADIRARFGKLFEDLVEEEEKSRAYIWRNHDALLENYSVLMEEHRQKQELQSRLREEEEQRRLEEAAALLRISQGYCALYEATAREELYREEMAERALINVLASENRSRLGITSAWHRAVADMTRWLNLQLCETGCRDFLVLSWSQELQSLVEPFRSRLAEARQRENEERRARTEAENEQAALQNWKFEEQRQAVATIEAAMKAARERKAQREEEEKRLELFQKAYGQLTENEEAARTEVLRSESGERLQIVKGAIFLLEDAGRARVLDTYCLGLWILKEQEELCALRVHEHDGRRQLYTEEATIFDDMRSEFNTLYRRMKDNVIQRWQLIDAENTARRLIESERDAAYALLDVQHHSHSSQQRTDSAIRALIFMEEQERGTLTTEADIALAEIALFHERVLRQQLSRETSNKADIDALENKESAEREKLQFEENVAWQELQREAHANASAAKEAQKHRQQSELAEALASLEENEELKRADLCNEHFSCLVLMIPTAETLDRECITSAEALGSATMWETFEREKTVVLEQVNKTAASALIVLKATETEDARPVALRSVEEAPPTLPDDDPTAAAPEQPREEEKEEQLEEQTMVSPNDVRNTGGVPADTKAEAVSGSEEEEEEASVTSSSSSSYGSAPKQHSPPSTTAAEEAPSAPTHLSIDDPACVDLIEMERDARSAIARQERDSRDIISTLNLSSIDEMKAFLRRVEETRQLFSRLQNTVIQNEEKERIAIRAEEQKAFFTFSTRFAVIRNALEKIRNMKLEEDRVRQSIIRTEAMIRAKLHHSILVYEEEFSRVDIDYDEQVARAELAREIVETAPEQMVLIYGDEVMRTPERTPERESALPAPDLSVSPSSSASPLAGNSHTSPSAEVAPVPDQTASPNLPGGPGSPKPAKRSFHMASLDEVSSDDWEEVEENEEDMSTWGSEKVLKRTKDVKGGRRRGGSTKKSNLIQDSDTDEGQTDLTSYASGTSREKHRKARNSRDVKRGMKMDAVLDEDVGEIVERLPETPPSSRKRESQGDIRGFVMPTVVGKDDAEDDDDDDDESDDDGGEEDEDEVASSVASPKSPYKATPPLASCPRSGNKRSPATPRPLDTRTVPKPAPKSTPLSTAAREAIDEELSSDSGDDVSRKVLSSEQIRFMLEDQANVKRSSTPPFLKRFIRRGSTTDGAPDESCSSADGDDEEASGSDEDSHAGHDESLNTRNVVDLGGSMSSEDIKKAPIAPAKKIDLV